MTEGKSWFVELLEWLGVRKARSTGVTPPPPPPPRPVTASLELFAAPGHGRTAYLWSLLFMLRQLSRVWPSYLCWPSDETTGRSLQAIHEDLRLGHLPRRVEPQAPQRHALDLRNLNPWGDRRLVVFDGPDGVFTDGEPRTAGVSRPAIDWTAPTLWLLSLSDLDEVRGRLVDLELDRLVRARLASGEAARERPFRLVVVLTKGDAIANLPTELRNFLKHDPLAKALASSPHGLFAAHDEVTRPRTSPAHAPEPLPPNDPLGAYFRSRHEIDRLIRGWMSSNSALRSLLGRAQDLEVDLRFSVVSATGSGFATDSQLATPWSPRRVLDPYFWSLDLAT